MSDKDWATVLPFLTLDAYTGGVGVGVFVGVDIGVGVGVGVLVGMAVDAGVGIGVFVGVAVGVGVFVGINVGVGVGRGTVKFAHTTRAGKIPLTSPPTSYPLALTLYVSHGTPLN